MILQVGDKKYEIPVGKSVDPSFVVRPGDYGIIQRHEGVNGRMRFIDACGQELACHQFFSW